MVATDSQAVWRFGEPLCGDVVSGREGAIRDQRSRGACSNGSFRKVSEETSITKTTRPAGFLQGNSAPVYFREIASWYEGLRPAGARSPAPAASPLRTGRRSRRSRARCAGRDARCGPCGSAPPYLRAEGLLRVPPIPGRPAASRPDGASPGGRNSHGRRGREPPPTRAGPPADRSARPGRLQASPTTTPPAKWRRLSRPLPRACASGKCG